MSLSSRLLEKTAEIQKSLDELNQMIVEKDFKPPQAEPKKEQPLMSQSGSLKKDLPPVEKAAPVKSEISVDWELLDYLKYGQVIKPKKFLGDLWSGIDQVLKANNYKWIRDGKESRWEFQAEPQGKPSPTVTANPPKTDTVEWLVKDGDKTVEARAGDEKAWAFVKKYDKDARKSTDEVKANNQSLYDFLKVHGSYVDGSYQYTMSRDEAFFNRRKL